MCFYDTTLENVKEQIKNYFLTTDFNINNISEEKRQSGFNLYSKLYNRVVTVKIIPLINGEFYCEVY